MWNTTTLFYKYPKIFYGEFFVARKGIRTKKKTLMRNACLKITLVTKAVSDHVTFENYGI